MNFIENIKDNNQFPIIFVGSGVTKRYFKNGLKWEQLLLELWNLVEEEKAFYTQYHVFENMLKSENLSKSDKEFKINLMMAGILEEKINNSFYSDELNIDNLTLAQAHTEHISPFRQCIANTFSNLERKEGFDEEIISFSKMLVKARFIVTTNYDNFIEECFSKRNVSIKVNVGNSGLFVKSNDYGELYKIHGSVKSPNTICITSEDYKNNESKLALVNAKILSNLTESPILFIGYSLTDKNIRELLTSYSENLPYEISEAAARIGVVEYTPDKIEIQDIVSNIPDLGIHYTKISTDNYKKIYDEISQIEQGYLPSEIAKFEGAFRKIIEVKGKEKELDTVLTSFIDISKINTEELKNKNIVVAFGDSKYIYKMPTYKDYIREYFSNSMELDTRIALLFLKKTSANYPVPYKKHREVIDSWGSIPNDLVQEVESLKTRISNFPESIVRTYSIKANKDLAKKYLPYLNKTSTIEDIMSLSNVPLYNKLRFILFKIDKFKVEELKDFIVKNIDMGEGKGISSTLYRKIVMSYSIMTEGI
ncbi:SIR2 family protein [Lactococcus lactis]|uniref:SIR2 family protein n=1 Tax=Lactococcus lactis TaxID=1358 RepID=UPI0026588BED|nr:SIR2 family protein [Lactococcus lactis]WKF73671.1 SIR2 family protein [Lactococcus lactis]